MSSLKKVPVLIQLNLDTVYSVDLSKELKIDKYNLDRELRDQAPKYMFWAGLLTEVSEKVDILEERLQILEAALYRKYGKRGYDKLYELKKKVLANPEYSELRGRIRRWKKAESQLKYAEKAFAKRGDILQTLSANQRREKESAT